MSAVAPAARRAARRRGSLEGLRFAVQALALLAINPLGFVRLQGVCLPVLNCHGCPLAATICPILAAGRMIELGLVPWLVLGIVGLAGALAGRLACGWICPFGFLQDLLARLPLPHYDPPRLLRAFKYLVLVAMVPVAAVLVGTASRFFFCGVCPAGALEASLPAWFKDLGNFSAVKLGVLEGFLLLALLVPRGFCRIICPLGASLALFNKVSVFRLGVDRQPCIRCGLCHKVCPMDADPLRADNPENCVRCLKCRRCPVGLIDLAAAPPLTALPEKPAGGRG